MIFAWSDGTNLLATHNLPCFLTTISGIRDSAQVSQKTIQNPGNVPTSKCCCFLCSASLKVRLVGVDVNWVGSLDPRFLKEKFPNPKSFGKKNLPKRFSWIFPTKKQNSHRILPKNLRSQRVAYRSGRFADGTWWESVTWIWSLFLSCFWSFRWWFETFFMLPLPVDDSHFD